MLVADARTIADVTGGELLSGAPDAVVRGLCIDSREVESGCAFVAFSGENTDGHAFAAEAVARGARAVLVTRDDDSVRAAIEAGKRPTAVIKVADALEAVQKLASHHRERLLCPVVGVTGSTGKTTTKDLLAAALSPLGDIVATKGNRNNELGVPLTVLSAGPRTGALVVEMAMRGCGQIAQLAVIARPTHGLVTNVGVSHIEAVGSAEAIVSAKGELVAAVPAGGAVFLNGDDAATDALAAMAVAEVVRYGLDPSCGVRAEDVTVGEDGRARFRMLAEGLSVDVALGVPGRHNVYNALAALAVAMRLGVSAEEAAEAVGTARMTDMRMQVVDTAAGVTVVNDAYNANPTSMRAALRTITEIATGGKRVAVLGGMAELGSLSELAHFQLGEEVARSGIDVLVTVGPLAERIAHGARADGMAEAAVRPCANVEEAIEVLDDLLVSGDVVLVKASRVVGLERVVEGMVTPRV